MGGTLHLLQPCLDPSFSSYGAAAIAASFAEATLGQEVL